MRRATTPTKPDHSIKPSGTRDTPIPAGAPEGLVFDRAHIEFASRGDGPSLVAVDDVSLRVGPGEFVCVVGPSGCGKSSLLLAVAGLSKLTSGTMSINGNAIDGPDRDRAMVFQAASLLPWRTVLANVSYGLELMHTPKSQARQRAMDVIKLVGLAGFESHYPHEVSGGMQQRVNLARALVVKPSALIMDEPFAALDAQTRELMQEELLRIWAETGTSVLFVTHQIDEAVYLGDRVVVLSRGPASIVLEEVATPFERPRHESLKGQAEFARLIQHISQLIRSERTA